jgi:hypothetical protein
VSTSPSDEVFINALRTIFGKQAIIFGEDPAQYDRLLALVAADVKPQTMREWLMVKDIVDAQWEFWRIRGFKAGVLHAALPHLITKQMAVAAGKDLTSKQVRFMREQLLRVLTGEEGAREAFTTLLAEYQLTMDGIATLAFQQQMPLQLEVDNRADVARDRRNGAYAELESLREKIFPRADIPSLPVGSPAQNMRYIDGPSSIVPTHPAEEPGRGLAPNRPPTETMPPPDADPARGNDGHVVDDRATPP